MKNSLFKPKVIALFLACAIALFALSVLLSAFEDNAIAPENKVEPGAYSTSAIGHAGFYDTLRRLGYPVFRSIGGTLQQTGSNGTLIVAEPALHLINTIDEAGKIAQAKRTLLVLPKWRGIPDDKRPTWVSSVIPVSLSSAQRTMTLVTSGDSDVVRVDWPGTWTTNEIGIQPAGTGVVQLIRSQDFRPIVGTDDGMLIGELLVNNRIIWVLADPDVINNHGLGKGDNAVFMLAALGVLRHWNHDDAMAPIVFDETVHGFRAGEASPLKLLFRFPFVVITILVCLTAVFAVLSGLHRFGAPRKPEPSLDFGKAQLLNNGARLLDYAGHHASVMQRYVRMTIRFVAQNLHAPANLSDAALAQWLDRIGKTRKIELSCAAILADVTKLNSNDKQTLTRLFKNAWDIHRWKGEMLHGSAINRRNR